MDMHVYKSVWDKISIGASIACTIHCVLLPLAFGALPFLGIELLENLALELATVAVSALLGGWVIYKGYYHFHRSKLVIVLFTIGITALVAGNLVEREALEMVLKLLGAIALVAAHLYNRSKCKNCPIHPKH